LICNSANNRTSDAIYIKLNCDIALDFIMIHSKEIAI